MAGTGRLIAELGTMPGPVRPAGGGAIKIEFAAGARMRITGAVDAATLKAAVAALADGRHRWRGDDHSSPAWLSAGGH
jgi:transposase